MQTDPTICAECKYSRVDEKHRNIPGRWRCAAVPKRVVTRASQHPITGEHTHQYSVLVSCDSLNGKGDCTKFAPKRTPVETNPDPVEITTGDPFRGMPPAPNPTSPTSPSYIPPPVDPASLWHRFCAWLGRPRV